MATIPFFKVEGLGNDFVVVDLRPGKPGAAAAPQPIEAALARLICDRHFGVGGDGVLAILPGDQGDVRMRVINADGSEAEMCGNGIRCVAKVLYDNDPALHRTLLRIDTGAGLLECTITDSGGLAASVAVQMGRPRLSRAEIPMTGSPADHPVRTALRALDRSFFFTGVSMGNPHAVTFLDEPAASLRSLAESYGPSLERDPTFPRRTNVEFARIRGKEGKQEIDLVVWERGCGITLACGTGACATAVAACLEGRIPPDQEIPVHLPGGTLFITVNSLPSSPDNRGSPAEFAGVQMRGPAHVVFAAELDLDRLRQESRPTT